MDKEGKTEQVQDRWTNTLNRAKELGKGAGKGKGKQKGYFFDTIPRWLAYSGLPKKLNQEFGFQAWLIFSRLVSLDCRFNHGSPDWFNQGYEEIASSIGLSRHTIANYIRRFEKAKLIRVTRGKFTGSKSRFKINDFRATPISPNRIKYINGGMLGSKGKKRHLRYYKSV